MYLRAAACCVLYFSNSLFNSVPGRFTFGRDVVSKRSFTRGSFRLEDTCANKDYPLLAKNGVGGYCCYVLILTLFNCPGNDPDNLSMGIDGVGIDVVLWCTSGGGAAYRNNFFTPVVGAVGS